MHTTALRKVGGSTMLVVPPVLLEILNVGVGSLVGLQVDNGKLVVEPEVKRRRSRYTLDQLIAKCDPSASMPADDKEWLHKSPVGGELL